MLIYLYISYLFWGSHIRWHFSICMTNFTFLKILISSKAVLFLRNINNYYYKKISNHKDFKLLKNFILLIRLSYNVKAVVSIHLMYLWEKCVLNAKRLWGECNRWTFTSQIYSLLYISYAPVSKVTDINSVQHWSKVIFIYLPLPQSISGVQY